MSEEIVDTTIIGGGPTGLFTAFYAGMREMSVKIVESLPELGGQLAALYPEKNIYDVGGYPEVTGKNLVEPLKKQAYTFNPEIVLSQTVQEVKKLDEKHFRIITDKEVHYSKTVIVTAGVGAFEPRKLELKNPEHHDKDNLHYTVDNLAHFKNKKVCISGGGDSAIDWALALEPIADKVTLVHRRDEFRAHESTVSQLRESSVEILTPFMITGLNGEGPQIEQVDIQDKTGKDCRQLSVEHVIVSHGFKSSLGPIKNWGIDMHKNSIVVDNNMETNIKGLYAAGDVTTYQSKLKLITLGFAEGPIAVSNAKNYIDPKSRIQPMHSTHIFERQKV